MPPCGRDHASERATACAARAHAGALDLAPGQLPDRDRGARLRVADAEDDVEEGVHPEIDFTLEKLSSLHIEADVSGADVSSIDDHAEGATPVQREVQAGLYRVQVQKPGYRAVTREVRVNAGDQVSLVVSLPPLPRERRLKLELANVRLREVSFLLDGDVIGVPPIERKVPSGATGWRCAARATCRTRAT